MTSTIKVDNVVNQSGDNASGLDLSTNDQIILKTANTTALTVDASQLTFHRYHLLKSYRRLVLYQGNID